MKAWLRSAFDIALIVLIVIAGKTAIAEPYYVPSGSMEPTLQIGDELLATKYPYGYSSRRCRSSSRCRTRSASSARCRSARHHRVPLARQPLADLGQARRRPAR